MVSGNPSLPHRLMGARGSLEITILMGPVDRYALAQLLQQRGKEPFLDPGWSMIPDAPLTTFCRSFRAPFRAQVHEKPRDSPPSMGSPLEPGLGGCVGSIPTPGAHTSNWGYIKGVGVNGHEGRTCLVNGLGAIWGRDGLSHKGGDRLLAGCKSLLKAFPTHAHAGEVLSPCAAGWSRAPSLPPVF